VAWVVARSVKIAVVLSGFIFNNFKKSKRLAGKNHLKNESVTTSTAKLLITKK
jgi:hypothetical protein